MEQDGKTMAETARCESCGNVVLGHECVYYGSTNVGYRLLCTRCFNVEVARQLEVKDFESIQFRPIALTDCEGNLHDFHIQARLLGSTLSLEAFEIEDDAPAGYQFQILGEADDDQFTLLGRLVERIRRSLSIKHLVQHEEGHRIAGQVVRGRIDWDLDTDGRLPLLIVDGRTMSWDEFGRMLAAFEGWQFRMEIIDRANEV